ncbi:MAG: hypothetical protein FWC64_03705 [Treponema sp.]|nr:hypothetical protein [Treponema sp.]
MRSAKGLLSATAGSVAARKVLDVVAENRVAILFAVLALGAFHASGMSTRFFFFELFTRFGRNTFMVLALLIPVAAGLGLNFGIVVGAMAAQIAVFLAVLWGWPGILGVGAAALVATPIAILFGLLIGKLFNRMKGSEMIGGMVLVLFAEGFYQFFFLFAMGGIIEISPERGVVTATGVGVLNALDLGRSGMRQALDDVSLLNILSVAVWAALALFAAMVAHRLAKRRPLELRGPGGLSRPLAALGALWLAYALSGFGARFPALAVDPFLQFLYYDRVVGLVGVRLAAAAAILHGAFGAARIKLSGEGGGSPSKPLARVAAGAAVFLATLHPSISDGLTPVRIPIFTYMIIVGLCFFINWFMKTRLGQNMRTVGHDRAVATAAGIDVDRTRIIAMILSTVLAAYGQIIMLQNFGVMQTYGAHSQVGIYAIAALLVGGATVSRASVKHAIMGVILFHSLFILAPIAGRELMGSALIGEYFRVFVANAVIAVALIMHAWKWVKARPKGAARPAQAAPR